jgi:hypothetical protein
MKPSQSNSFVFLVLFVTSSSLVYLSECSVDQKPEDPQTSEAAPKDANDGSTEKPIVVSSTSESKDVSVDCETLLPGQFLCNELASIDPATQQPAGKYVFFNYLKQQNNSPLKKKLFLNIQNVTKHEFFFCRTF